MGAKVNGDRSLDKEVLGDALRAFGAMGNKDTHQRWDQNSKESIGDFLSKFGVKYDNGKKKSAGL